MHVYVIYLTSDSVTNKQMENKLLKLEGNLMPL